MPTGCKGSGAEEGWRQGSRDGVARRHRGPHWGQRHGGGLEVRRRGSRPARVGRGRPPRCSLAARAGRVGGGGAGNEGGLEELQVIEEGRGLGFEWVDPIIVYDCTNLKYWKVREKKIFQKMYRIHGAAARYN